MIIQFSRLLILSACIFLLTIPYSVIHPAHGAPVPTLFISPASQPLAPPNSLVTFNVSVSNMPAFAGWDIAVKAGDASILRPTRIDALETFGGTFTQLTNCIDGAGSGCSGLVDGAGVAHSGGYSSSTDSGNVTLFKVTFNSKAANGYTFLSLPSPLITYVIGNDITPSIGNVFGATYGNAASPPIAEFSWSPLIPFAGDPVIFNASLSSDPSGGIITTYDWGTQLTTVPIATMVFLDRGNHSVTLTVTNNKGLKSAPTTHVIEVRTKPPPCPPGLSTIHVPAVCPTISDAIDSVVPGGTILVASGQYNESLAIFKPLILQGEGRGASILNGSVYLETPNATISGFALGPITIVTSSYSHFHSDRNVISDNTIVGSMIIQDARGTILTDNRIKSVIEYPDTIPIGGGLQLDSSPDSLLRGNVLENNTTFGVFGERVGDYVQDIDSSNTIAGKPIYYFVNIQSPAIPVQIGYLGLVESSDVTVGPRSIAAGVVIVGTRNVEMNGVRTQGGVEVIQSSNIVLRNSTFLRSGIRIRSSNTTVIQHSVISNGVVNIENSTNTRVLTNRIVADLFFGGFYGINVWASERSVIAHNFVSNFFVGIDFFSSSFNQLEDNAVQNSPLPFSPPLRFGIGILLENSPQNTFRENRIDHADSGLEVTSRYDVNCHPEGCQIKHLVNDFVQDIDTSNTIDGRPIYYVVDRSGVSIPANAGYIGIVNSTEVRVTSANLAFSGDGIHIVASSNIIIENANITGTNSSFETNPNIWAWDSHGLTVRNNREISGTDTIIGILLEDCMNTTIEGNIILPGYFRVGIALYNSTYSKIDGNYVSWAILGIVLGDSNNNIIERNTLQSSSFGILLSTRYFFEPRINSSLDNLIIENTIARNEVGLEVDGFGNTIYHNNFLNNYVQASGMNNTWDNRGGQGNYWSDYTGQDLDRDGIGDTLVPHLGLDNYPLISPWIPNGLSSTFVGRGAWGSDGETGSSAKSDVIQTLFAAARNDGRSPEWMQAVFNTTSQDGVTRTLLTMPVWVSSGQRVILSPPILLSPGTYRVSVQLRFSADAFLARTIAGTRTFSVNVR